jgi:hypothetical protein
MACHNIHNGITQICRYEVVKAPYRCYALELPFDLLIANESEDARREYKELLAETERLLGMSPFIQRLDI